LLSLNTAITEYIPPPKERIAWLCQSLRVLALAWRILLGVLLSSISAYADAQTAQQKPNLRFNTLKQPKLDAIGAQNATIQDEQGYMWFGGANGLARFDGYEVKVYQSSNEPNSLSNSNILDLLVDNRGALWVATANGLNRYRAHSDDFISYHTGSGANALSHNHVSTLLMGSQDVLWVGTQNGLNKLDTGSGSVESFRSSPSSPSSPDSAAKLTDKHITALYEDGKGRLWVGTWGNGIYRLEPRSGRVIHYPHLPTQYTSAKANSGNRISNNSSLENISTKLSHPQVAALFEDRHGYLWIGTFGGGLNRLDLQTEKFTHYRHHSHIAHSLAANIVRAIRQGASGHIWIATGGGGLDLLDIRSLDTSSGHFHHFVRQAHEHDGLVNNRINTMFEDSIGDVWFGHFPFGISKLDREASAFKVLRHQAHNRNSLSYNDVISLDEDSKGRLWVGTEKGLNLVDLKRMQIRRFQHHDEIQHSLSASPVIAVKSDSHDVVWAGTWRGGLNRFLTPNTSDNSEAQARFKHYLPSSEPWVIYEDQQWALWVGTGGGKLHRYNRGEDNFEQFQIAPGSASPGRITVLYEDRERNFWLGTDTGLYRFNRELNVIDAITQPPKVAQSLRSHALSAITQDVQGKLWLGTFGGGAVEWDVETNSIRRYLVKDGLADNLVTGIIEDELGMLWFATGNGLSRLNPKTGTFRNFSKRDGIASNLHHRPAAIKLTNGTLAFGSSEGLTLFHPKDIVSNPVKPPIVITDFQLFNRPAPTYLQTIERESKLHLKHHQSVFTFKFAALNFRDNEKNQYAYRLLGFDKNWQHVDHRRTATYTNLDSGNYIFQVKGSNNNGLWNDVPLSVNVHIETPWWRSWWAYCLYVSAICALATLIIHAHNNRKNASNEHKLNCELEQRVAIKTEQLRQSNEGLRQGHEKLAHSHQQLQQAHTQLQHAQGQLVQSEKMSSLGALVSGVGHEINNPNNYCNTALFNLDKRVENFRGFIFSLIDEEGNEELLEKFNKHFEALRAQLSNAQDGSDRIKEIVANLHTFSRKESNPTQKAKLSKGLLSTLQLVSANFKDKIEFVTDIKNDPELECCASELNQVFMNLMVNACQAMSDGGCLHLSMYERMAELVICFKDDGCGMSDETQQRVFEPFYTTKPEGEGTGLGMAISFGIIERQKGRIEVESQLGEGTQIRVYLPL